MKVEFFEEEMKERRGEENVGLDLVCRCEKIAS